MESQTGVKVRQIENKVANLPCWTLVGYPVSEI